MKFTEEQIKSMASPISQSEDEKCKNAIKMIRDAMVDLDYTDDGNDIKTYSSDTFSYSLEMRQRFTNKKIVLLVQGSYANKTNIPSESDVDVAVILVSSFTAKYRKGLEKESYGFTEATFTAEDLKDEVLLALNKHFHYSGVTRHDKCIKVTGNSYRVDADVVPAYRFRNYESDFSYNENNYIRGIEIHPDSGGSIINYPEEHIRQDIIKNRETNFRFKKCVRIIKNMREIMEQNYFAIPSCISSFGLESILWNVKNSTYSYFENFLSFSFKYIIDYLNDDFTNFDNYKEANGIKPLFTDVHVKSEYQVFINNLKSFYECQI